MTNFLSFTSVLFCNKIPQTGWLESTKENYLICSVGLKSGHDVAGFSDQHLVAEIKMLAQDYLPSSLMVVRLPFLAILRLKSPLRLLVAGWGQCSAP